MDIAQGLISIEIKCLLARILNKLFIPELLHLWKDYSSIKFWFTDKFTRNTFPLGRGPDGIQLQSLCDPV